MPLPPNGDVKQKNFPVIYSLRHLSPPKAYLTIQTQIYVVQIQSQNLVIRNWNNETTGKTRIALTTHYLNHDQMLSHS